ncbi:ADP-ribosylglycohydrolase family protein [Zooshikella harenae]|uniref:ADP-ribosylglycohydrolase family protein n=1 Tax=Zooshikella harenae TaxID=2827238 RepID=UPI0028169331|nr:ADP-ribosylglycohydrolase family protein [Zooshikella harenae]
MKDRIKGALVGLACGDAVGTTLEFKPKGSFTPIKDMVGGGPFNLEKGQWTDDTSMALCLAHSLLYQKGFDPTDQMNRYCNWYQHGYMSCNGECFDIGITVTKALNQYLKTNNPFCGSEDKYSSGNGSLMRLAPIPIFYQSNYEQCIFYAGESSRTTDASVECIEACKLFASLILSAFESDKKIEGIAHSKFIDFNYDDNQGSGYVVESLNSALWCFFNSNSFEESILLAANLGNDADTTAAICGQIAGAFYGFSAIPKHWREGIYMAKEIENLAIDLYQTGKDSV